MGLRIGWALAISLVVVFSAACSDDETNTGGSDRAFDTTVGASGSRLRARFVGTGNAKLLIGFHDNERNEDCTFQDAEAGKIRCLPESLRAQSGPDLITFSDATCQTPVLIGVVPACTDVKYGIRTSSEFDPNCNAVQKQTVREIRKRDANVPGTTFTNNGAPGNGCTAQPSTIGQPQGTTTALAAFTEVVPWTAFVEAIETPTPRDNGAIIERVLVATDGARQHIGYRAPLNGGQSSECSFHVMADGITRCVPEKGSGGGPVIYSDIACRQPLFVRDFSSSRSPGCSPSSSSASEAKGLWLEPSKSICGGISAVYSLADSFEGEINTVFQWNAESKLTNPSNPTSPRELTVSCKLDSVNPPSSSGSQQGLRSVTGNLTGSLPTSRRWQNGGRGARLVSALVPDPSAAGGRSRDGFENQLQQGFHDSERGVDCTFERATDGKLRCLPVAASAVVFNTDQECKATSTVAVLSSSPCVASAKFARVTVAGTCPAVTKIYALGDAATARDVPNVSTRVSAEGCARVQQVIGAVDATEVDPSQFVEGAATTE